MAKKNRPKSQCSFRQVMVNHLRPSHLDAKCTTKHIREVERHLIAWESFWSSKKSRSKTNIKKPNVQNCSREHLEVFRRHLMAQAKELSVRTVNKYLGSIRAILVSADKNGLLKRRPKLEQLPNSIIDPARKIYLRNEQIDALFASADSLAWPPEKVSGLSPSVWWKCAIVLYRTYGFRTQELLTYESGKQTLTWENIRLQVESPNPASEQTNEHGWLVYVPPKTKKKKPNPLYLPLTKHARAAIDLIAVGKVSDDSPLFRMPHSQQGFLKQWYRWFELADVKPKIEDASYKPYCLRKTAATYLSQHKPGLATAICGWGTAIEAKVANDHYVANDLLIQEILNAPMPKSFDSLIHLPAMVV